MAEFKAGDPVIIFKHRTRYDTFPADGYEAAVIKVGRKYATAAYVRQRAAYPAGPVTETIEFDMETGRERGGTSNYGRYVRTPEQVELDRRLSAAMSVLTNLRIRLERKFTLEQIEALAQVARTFADPAQEG
jgi:hypothetical protein